MRIGSSLNWNRRLVMGARLGHRLGPTALERRRRIDPRALRNEDGRRSKEPIATGIGRSDDEGVGTTSGATQTRRRCVLVDDHEAIVSSLGALLEHEGFVVVGRAGTGADAIRLFEEHQPDFGVVDLRLPDMTGLDIARATAQVSSETALVVHTSEADPTTVRALLAAGVHGVVLKAIESTQLLLAISAALAGRTHVDPTLTPPSPDG
jgi:CheY-like chemotaxis protein